jgi:hypothetical protein
MKNFFTIITILFGMNISFAGEGNNHIAIFTGLTTGESNAATTVGLEYEYKLPILERKIGLGVFYENVSGDHTATVSGAGLIYHLPYHLRTNLSIGEHAVHGHKATITRVGLAYDHHIGKYAISPTINIDKSKYETVSVYGLAFGMSF